MFRKRLEGWRTETEFVTGQLLDQCKKGRKKMEITTGYVTASGRGEKQQGEGTTEKKRKGLEKG